jgi:TonB family protein
MLLKFVRVFPLLFILVACASATLAQTSPNQSVSPPPAAAEYNPAAWKELSSPESGFSVMMVGIPLHVTQELDTPAGKTKLHVYMSDSGAVKYAVAFADLPCSPDNTDFINGILDGASRQALSYPGRKLVGEKSVNVNGIPAHEILVEDGKKVTRKWFLSQGAHFYEVMLVTPENIAFNMGKPSYDPKDWTDLYQSMVTKFFGSFRLLPTQASVQPAINSAPAPAIAAEYNAEAWKEFAPPEGGFSVLMVGAPKYRTQEVASGPDRVVRHIYTAGSVNANYVVMFADLSAYPKAPESIREVLDAGRDALLAGSKEKTVLSEKEMAVAGHIARDLLVDGGTKFYRVQFFYAGGRLFQLELETPTNVAFKLGRPSSDAHDWTDLYQSMCEKFFGSFKLLTVTPPGGAVMSIRYGDPITHSGETETEPKAQVSGGILNGRAISMPLPKYPADARAAGASGEVSVKVVFDESGNVIWAKAISGQQLLRSAAEDAARRTTFKPVTLSGKPMKVSGILLYKFNR